MSKVKTNNYVYQSKKKEEAPKQDFKKIYFALAALGVLLLTVVILVCVEKGMENKLIVQNKSSHTIKKLQFWYEDENGGITDIMDFDDVLPKTERKESTENLPLSELMGDSWLSVYMVFEDGGEALVQTGQFLYDFEGRISFELDDTKDEELILRLKAGEGLFNSTAITGCDDVYYINPKEGYNID